MLRLACSTAEKEALTPVVLTFEPHPAEVLFGAKLWRLTALPRKVELLLGLHPSLRVVVEPFTIELSQMSPESFAERILLGGLQARRVVVGRNFRFGHGRAGDLARLTELGKGLGFVAEALELAGDGDGPYSSTRARDALNAGNMQAVRSILGRPHALTGQVVAGDRRGRSIGFPTANLDGVAEVKPKAGVYATLVDIERGGAFERLGLGAMNIGVRPTVAAGASTEVHVLDFDGDLYGSTLRVHVIERLRDEQRFDGLAQLKRQLAVDVADARQRLASLVAEAGAGAAWF